MKSGLIACLLALSLLSTTAGAAAPPDASPQAQGTHEFTTHGQKLWYRVSGHGPVMLTPSPGWGPSSDYLSSTLKPLEDRYTMVYLDTRGSGRSPPSTQKDVSWNDLVGDLEALRAHLSSDHVWLLGHSMGGVQVLSYALAHPRHVAGLLLVDSTATIDMADVQMRAMRRQNEPWFAKAMQALSAPATSPEKFSRDIQDAMPLYFARADRIAQHASDLATTTFSATAMNQAEVRSAKFDLTSQLPTITVPALIVVGTEDFICSPKLAEALHRGLPNSKLLVIEDSGHFPFVEQPKAFFDGVFAFLPTLDSRER